MVVNSSFPSSFENEATKNGISVWQQCQIQSFLKFNAKIAHAAAIINFDCKTMLNILETKNESGYGDNFFLFLNKTESQMGYEFCIGSSPNKKDILINFLVWFYQQNKKNMLIFVTYIFYSMLLTCFLYANKKIKSCFDKIFFFSKIKNLILHAHELTRSQENITSFATKLKKKLN